MEKKQYNLCLEVLRRFHKHKLLSEFILIGSWCIVFYGKYFFDPDYIRRISLITRDIDFLIDRPQTVKAKVDIPELLKDLGFITTYKGRQGYMKLDHPELILEFLTRERGRGRDTPFPLPSLHVNATKGITNAFPSIPRKWQTKVLKTIQQTEETEILKLLQSV